MPPDQQALSNTSLLAALSGAGPVAGGGLMNARTPGGTFIGILNSQTAQDEVINHFDLLHVYHYKLHVDARNILTERTSIKEDSKSGIISISVTDRDPNRARDIAKGYVEELDRLLTTLSTSSARREREFLEERLKDIKSDLDASSVALSQFSSRNATINPQSQGQTLIAAASGLQGELISAQSELSGLKAMYSDDNVRVREAQARIDELQNQLRKMGNTGGKVGGADRKGDQFYPSIRELPLLGVTYSDLSQKLAMQEGIYETLNRQYELAKVEEAKEIPSVKVLDEPAVPERKSSPHRSIIVLLGVLVSAFLGTAWIVACKLWEITYGSHSVKVRKTAFDRTARGHDATAPN
jgi:capsule polysaccharide export protein KpsE/RkpR